MSSKPLIETRAGKGKVLCLVCSKLVYLSAPVLFTEQVPSLSNAIPHRLDPYLIFETPAQELSGVEHRSRYPTKCEPFCVYPHKP